MNEFLELLNENHDSNEMDPSFVDFSYLRRKGKHGCGYECLSKLSISEMPCSFINTEIRPANTMNSYANLRNGGQTHGRNGCRNVHKKDIISVLFTKTAQWQKDLKDIFKGATPFMLVEASGSVKSILDWAKTAKLDRDQ